MLKNVVSSAAECEIVAAFENGQDATVTRRALQEMGHQQPPTTIQLDNTTATSFTNGTLKQKRTKRIDMKYYWLQHRQQQKDFKFHWKPGAKNLADPFAKHHGPKENIIHRRIFNL